MSSPPFTLAACVPPNPSTTRGQPTKLDVSPKGDRLIYTNGRSVIVRPFPGLTSSSSSSAPTIIYSQHAHPVTIARISPSGAYIASADTSGLIRIWDILGTDQTLKAEYRPFAGTVRDLAWDGESKRLAVVGQGKERFGHFFFVDSGASCGEVTGHAKVLNAVALRSVRPFRAVAGGDDNNLVLYNGVPYKYASTIKEHSRFVQAVVYSKDGAHFASAGSDGKVVIYDGASGEVKVNIDVGAGTVFDVQFAADGKHLYAVGADGLARAWSVPQGQAVGQWDVKAGHGNAGDQLVGLTLSGSTGVALNLAGELISFDTSKPGANETARHVAPTRGISAALQLPKGAGVLAASWDGNVYRYRSTDASSSSWTVDAVQGYKAGGPVVTTLSLAPGSNDFAYAVGMDDVLRRISFASSSSPPSVDASWSIPLPTASRGQLSIDARTSTLYLAAASTDELLVLPSSSSSKQFTRVKLPTGCTPTTVLAIPEHNLVAVGAQDGKVHLFPSEALAAAGGAVKPTLTLERNRSAITHLSLQPSSNILASADGSGKILLFSLPQGTPLSDHNWVFHSSRVDCLSWLPDAQEGVAVSGGLDTHLYMWARSKPNGKRDVAKNSHAGGVGWVDFLEGGKGGQVVVVSAGSDGAIKVWRAPAGK